MNEQMAYSLSEEVNSASGAVAVGPGENFRSPPVVLLSLFFRLALCFSGKFSGKFHDNFRLKQPKMAQNASKMHQIQRNVYKKC